LRDAVAAFYCERVAAVVDEDYFDFSPIIGVDCSGGIEDGYAMFQSQPASRTNLYFQSFRYIKAKSGGYQNTFTRSNHNILIHSGANIAPARPGRHTDWYVEAVRVWQAFYSY